MSNEPKELTESQKSFKEKIAIQKSVNRDKRLAGSDRQVFNEIAFCSANITLVSCISMDTIAGALGMYQRNVSRSISKLYKLGYLVKMGCTKNGVTEYRLSSPFEEYSQPEELVEKVQRDSEKIRCRPKVALSAVRVMHSQERESCTLSLERDTILYNYVLFCCLFNTIDTIVACTRNNVSPVDNSEEQDERDDPPVPIEQQANEIDDIDRTILERRVAREMQSVKLDNTVILAKLHVRASEREINRYG